MNIKKKFLSLFFLLGFFSVATTHAQKDQINWISFEQLEDSMNVKPKKILISFYADWCSYCKKMEKVAYQDPKVISILNKDYYAVKMNAESKDTIVFEGKKFYNEELGKKRNPTHQIPLILASRKGYPFSLPVTLFLDEKFRVIRREFQYVSAKKMVRVLR
jgi:thioredoxin-related protein